MTRPTSCSTKRRKLCWRESRRWSGSLDPKVSASTSFPKTLSIFRTQFSDSSATECNTPCGHLPLGMKKRFETAAQTFRQNPKLDTALAITELEVGEALVSTLEPSGAPSVVQRALIAPPSSRIGPITLEERRVNINSSPLFGKYEDLIDRESAYEKLKSKSGRLTQGGESDAEIPSKGEVRGEQGWGLPDILTGTGRKDGVLEALAKGAARSIGSSIGRQIVRGILGSILKGR